MAGAGGGGDKAARGRGLVARILLSARLTHRALGGAGAGEIFHGMP